MDVLIHGHGCRRHLSVALAALPWVLCFFAQSAHAVGSDANAQAMTSTVVAREQMLPLQATAYGQVEPTSIVNVRVVNPGTLSDLHVLPGSIVSAGEMLARVSGPRMRSLLTQRETALQSAEARLDAATHALAIARSQLAVHLATRQAVDAATSELAAARASEQTAKAQLAETGDFEVIKAPTAGSVIEVHAADGEQAQAGETLLTIQPRGRLWVRAKFYGEDASTLRIGMTGHFAPAGSGASIAVKVATIAPAIGADGGLQVGLVTTSQADWVSGQWGNVTLDLPSTRFVMVPTTALILDRGEWWVLVHTPKGNQPRQVVPGPTRGWQTAIVSGLRSGEQIVSQNAFLEYHRGIAERYQPPD